jgi:hypothetical protein
VDAPAADRHERAAALVSCGRVSAPPGLAPAPLALPPPLGTADAAPAGDAAPKNADVWVVVVNAGTCEPFLEEGAVGEVWTRSASVARGYFGAADATRATFCGRLRAPLDLGLGGGGGGADAGAAAAAADAFAVDWLRTGDLGFIAAGELFICGRSKDLIIVRGRNFFPQDLEAAAVAAGGGALRPGCAAAFVSGGGGGGAGGGGGLDAARLVLVVEVRAGVDAAQLPALAAAVRDAVKVDFSLQPSAVALLAPGAVRKTTSGKVARAFNRRAWDARAADAPAAESPWHAAAKAVLYEWADAGAVLGGGGADDFVDGANTGVAGDALLTRGGTAGGAAPYDHAKASLEGAALRDALLRDVAALLRLAPEAARALSGAAALHELGVDSLTLSGLAPRLRHEYALCVTDAQVFADACSVDWLVASAAALRAGEVPLPELAGGADATPNAIQGRPAERPRRTQLSSCQRDFPCFLICCG